VNPLGPPCCTRSVSGPATELTAPPPVPYSPKVLSFCRPSGKNPVVGLFHREPVVLVVKDSLIAEPADTGQCGFWPLDEVIGPVDRCQGVVRGRGERIKPGHLVTG